MVPKCDPLTKKYFEKLSSEVNELYSFAEKIRSLGYDVKEEVEIKRATNLAERTEAILEIPGLAKRYKEIMTVKKDIWDTIVAIFDEIIEGKLGTYENDEKRLETAVRCALTLYTQGVVVAPLEGIPKIKINSNDDGSKYVDIYFAGPIRAAGGTGSVFPVIFAWYGANKLSLSAYKASKQEIDRYIEEYNIIQKKYSRQIKLSEEELKHIIKNCPVCINGEATETDEVEVNRDLPRVETNKLRGGAFLVLTEGITLKAAKLKKFAKKFGYDWSWLDRFIKVKSKADKIEILPNPKYLEGAAGGRPFFAYPSRFGAFRLRYGRTRTTGLMAKAIHPATMYVLDSYLAVGTQMKIERPGKATIVSACSVIEPPYVKLDDSSIVRVESKEQYEKIKDKIKRILFIGDILVPLGDFRKSAHPLMKPGFCEEWWALYYEKATGKKIDPFKVSEKEALHYSKEFSLPMHPRYIYFYNRLNKEDIEYLHNAVLEAKSRNSFALRYSKELDEILTKAVVPMKVKDSFVYLDSPLVFFEIFEKPLSNKEDILSALSEMAGFEIKDKAGSFIGARMGRPESASERKMKGSPQGLFPIGKIGGSTRSINKAALYKAQESADLFGNNGHTNIEIAFFKCMSCKNESPYPYCFKCKQRTFREYFCWKCDKAYIRDLGKCLSCGSKLRPYSKKNLDINYYFNEAVKRLSIEAPKLVKGVEGLTSASKIAEPLEKAILRAKNGVYVFKDGVCRVDLLDHNITHFRPEEVSLSIEKLKELGYTHDIYGKELVSEKQMLRLFPQDVIINSAVGDYLVKVANYIDDLLEKYYGMPRFYNAKKKEDLIGHYLLTLAPHIVAGTVARILSFSDARVIFCHPYMTTARRRNTDGDQDSAMLLLDVFINFSKEYLPSSRGGKQDTPLVATVLLNPEEIDDEAYEIETVSEYPLSFYEAALENKEPYLKDVDVVENHVGKESQFTALGFTHDTNCYDEGPKYSRYKTIKEMKEKIERQLDLQMKIDAVDHIDALEKVLSTHFMPDIIGNARKFARQSFRCAKCNNKYRRMPLSGKCTCGGKISLTIAEGSVRKYLSLADEISKKYPLTDYLKQRIDLIKKEVDSLFNNEKIKQKSLSDFF